MGQDHSHRQTLQLQARGAGHGRTDAWALGLPVSRAGQRIGVFGGSFDPAHGGHVLVSQIAMARFRLDAVWWLVSPGNPLKTRQPAPLAQRMRTARAMLDTPRIHVIAPEAVLGTRTSHDTVRALRGYLPGRRLVWIMGGDNLRQFHHWHRWRDLAGLIPMGIIARPGARVSALSAPAARTLRHARLPVSDAGRLADCSAPAWCFVTGPLSDLSSTEIRGGRL